MKLSVNLSGYRFERHDYLVDGLASVDATYILHLEGNGRFTNIQKQLQYFTPTKTIYILYNSGYKSGKKRKEIDRPPADIFDAYLQIFNHSKRENHNTILILEDDFFFDEKIKDAYHQTNINQFLLEHASQDFIYYLGCIPILQIPYDYNTNIAVLAGAAHSVIYSKAYREKIINTIHKYHILDWDYLLLTTTFFNKYCYYTPLCYQLFPKTDNAKLWGTEISKTFSELFVLIAFTIIQFLQLDVQPYPGYSFFYLFSKILPVFIIGLLILTIVLHRKTNINTK
jgi:hypothetical protein